MANRDPGKLLLASARKKSDAANRAVAAAVAPAAAQAVPAVVNPIFDSYKDNPQEVEALIRQSPQWFEHFCEEVQPIIEHGRRGRRPSISTWDAVFLYLIVLCSGSSIARTAAQLHYKESTVSEAVARVRSPCLAVLKRRWWEARSRFSPARGDAAYPLIALATDSTSFQINKPVGTFDEAKAYWDAHNGIYGLKKEVAVSTMAPHFALFSKPHAIGSRNDFNYFCDGANELYGEYLRRSPAELAAFPAFQGNYWTLLTDSGYTGDAHTLFGKVTLAKPSQLHDDAAREQNRTLARTRVVVEQFFGRMKSLFLICQKPYPFDRSHFDTDIDVCILLTNEHIAHHALGDADYDYIERLQASVRQQQQAKAAKRRSQVDAYLERKKHRQARIAAGDAV